LVAWRGIRGVDGTKEVRSTAREGSATISAELLLGTKQDRALNDVKSAVDRITYVELTGIRPLEISIEVPQAELRKHHVTLDEIAARIRAASVEFWRQAIGGNPTIPPPSPPSSGLDFLAADKARP
jgi:multidrug efflux pump subunit AcrB